MSKALWYYLFCSLCLTCMGCREWQHECACIHDPSLSAQISPIPISNDIQANNPTPRRLVGAAYQLMAWLLDQTHLYALANPDPSDPAIPPQIPETDPIPKSQEPQVIQHTISAIPDSAPSNPSDDTSPTPTENQNGDRNGCIDINLDELNKLTMLPGIGPGKAKAIIQAREKRPFKRKKDITRVKGIGIQTYKKMSDQICDTIP